jgi:hypothetical protein
VNDALFLALCCGNNGDGQVHKIGIDIRRPVCKIHNKRNEAREKIAAEKKKKRNAGSIMIRCFNIRVHGYSSFCCYFKGGIMKFILVIDKYSKFFVEKDRKFHEIYQKLVLFSVSQNGIVSPYMG